MTIRIEIIPCVDRTIIRVIGHMEAEHLSELEAQIAAAGSSIVIEMQEVMLLDIDAVRFLARREKQGIALRGCSPYIREWINREGQD